MQKTKNKKQKTFETKVCKLLQQVKDDKNFSLLPVANIAYYFRDALRQAGYVMTFTNWEKTKKAAVVIAEDDDLKVWPADDWFACIDWCFSDIRYTDPFWRQVSILHLGTVIKARNHFVQWRQRDRATQIQSVRRINYG